MEVRPVRPEEHEEAGRVTALAYEEFGLRGDDGWGSYLERLADVAGRADRTLVLVAVEEGRIVGSATLELDARVPGGHQRPPLGAREAHLRMLGVDPGARGRGIGRMLVEACIREARRAGKAVLTLDTTERMRAARRMYEAMGFRREEDLVYDDGFRLLQYALDL